MVVKWPFFELTKPRKIYIFAFCVITFEPIKILNCLAPQNDGLNLSFVKDIKCPEMVEKQQLVQAGGGGYQ